MKGQVIAVERNARVLRAALMTDGRLDALEIDRIGEKQPMPGAIYRCRISEIMPAIGAAFADLGAGQGGFFPDAQGLTVGQTVLAQVKRESDGDKAARLTVEIQYRGQGIVFTPTRPGINVSRKIADVGERARLSVALASLAEKGGFVLRTTAVSLSADDLLAEARRLVGQHEALHGQSLPGCLLPAPDAFARVLEAAPANTPVIANAAAVDALRMAAQVEEDPFDHLDIDTHIASLIVPRIALGEGWMSVDATPALVAVDVNTGEARGGNALLRVNLDAATRLPGVLALRRLGGVVMVDFAGAPKGDARKRIEQAITRAAHAKLGSPRLHGWGPAGLFEMACVRPGRSLVALMKEDEE